MATAEGGATVNLTTSSYGGGGVGGKFRKKPLRKQATPYDRPPTAHQATGSTNSSTSGWFTKLIVDPASKILSYGVSRFAGSVLRKSLPSPPPLQPPEVDSDVSKVVHGAVIKNLESAQDPPDDEITTATENSRGNGISELEQLLKRKTFSRSEIAHLTQLLQSRAVESSIRDDDQRNKVTVPDPGQHQQLSIGFAEENKIDGTMSSADMLTHPLNSNSKVPGDDIVTPAELAKAYMGSRPSKASSSILGIRQQGGMEDIGLLGTRPFTSQMSALSLPKKTSVGQASPQNAFVTPRSRGRSAIYSMARTPYFKVQPTSAFKGSRNNGTGNNGPSMPLSSLPMVRTPRSDEIFDHQPMTLKRRSSVLEDEVGSIGSIRRIRQKSNILAPKIHHSNRLAIGSGIKQKLQLIGEPCDKVLPAVGETEIGSVPRTRLACVPSKSSEVAARIFQHLENLTPKEKSSEVAVRERTPMKVTSGMLSGQALRSSTEDVDSPMLLSGGEHDHKLGDSSIFASPNSDHRSFQKPRNTKENGSKVSVAPTEVSNNGPAVTFTSLNTTITTDVVENGATQPSQKKRSFRMSAPGDSMEHDDQANCNGSAPKLSSVKMGTVENPPAHGKSAPPEVPKSVKPTIPTLEGAMATTQSVVVPFSTAAFEKPMESNNPTLFSFKSNSAEKFPVSPSDYSKKTQPKSVQATMVASSEVTATPPPVVVPFSTADFHKPAESNNSSLFSFTSKSAEKFPGLPSDYSKKPQPKFESTGSFIDVSASAGSQGKIPESDKFGPVNPQAGDTNDKSDGINQISAGGAPAFTSFTSSSGAPSGNNFGFSGNSSNFAGSLFKFGGTSADSAVSVAKTSEMSDTRTKVDITPNSGSSSVSNSSATAPDVAKTGSTIAEFGSSVSQPIVNLQGSLFGSVPKPVVFGGGSVSQGTPTLLPGSSASSAVTTSQGVSALSVSSAPPLFLDNRVNSSGSLSNPLVVNPSNTFGLSSSASSSYTNTAALPDSGAASSVFRSGAGPTSEGAGVTSTSGATPSIFSFGLNSQSSSNSAAGANSSSSLTKFNFGGSSLASALASNAASSFGSSSSANIFKFGESSTSSGATSSLLSSSVQSSASSIFGSCFTSASPSTGFAFGASSSSASLSSTSFAPINSTSSVMPFNSSAGASSSPFFSFTSGTNSAPTSQPLPSNNNNNTRSVFGSLPAGGFSPSGNNDQMNAEDSMAEDPNPSQSTTPSVASVFGQSSAPGAGVFGQSSTPAGGVFGQSSTPPAAGVFGQSSTPAAGVFGQSSSTPAAGVFGQSSSTPAAGGFAFGSSTVPAQPQSFMFGNQPNQAPVQNPSPFQASGSLDINAGGSFSLGSGGGDKSGRRIVKINRSKNRKR